jgi:hypothetical protein
MCLAPVLAQNPTATIVGTIRDATGAVIAGASIGVRNTETNDVRTAQAGAEGEFTLPNLPAGIYEVTVRHTGFRTLIEKNLELQLEQVARLDLKLEVGGVAETIEVTATIPLLNTENAVKGEVMVAQEVVEMPLNGRDFNDLSFLTPNVVPAAQGGAGSALNINGARADNTNFIIDGFNDQNPKGAAAQARPNIDALQEFKMQTGNFSAEYGRLAGGVVNMVLKSGANAPHGTLFEFVRNYMFDARGFFDPEVAPLRRNQFGGLLSGPVWIPKVYNGRNRTFFLFSWESYRNGTSDTTLARVPTLLERQGNFTQSGIVPKDPVGGANFPGAIVPASRFSPIALKAAAFYPQPNRAGVNNLLTTVPDTDHWDSFLMKFDERISNNDNVSYRYTKKYNRTTNPLAGSDAPSFGNNVKVHQCLMGVTYTHMFSPVVINEGRLGFSRTASHTRGFHAGHDYAADFGLTGVTTDPQLIGFPRFTINGYAVLGDTANTPVDFWVNNIQGGDTLTWVKGRHLFKFGGEVLRTQFFMPYNNQNRGVFAFQGKWTNQSYADFLLGLQDSSKRQVGTTPNYLLGTNYSFFAQDDWKVSSKLTISLGLRYEIPKPPLEKYGRLTNFIPDFGKLVLADDRTLQGGIGYTNADLVTTAKALGIPQTLIYTRFGDLGPRVGFAWRPLGGNRSVVRGGYGIFYGTQLMNSVRNDLANVFPFAISQTVNRKANDVTYLTMANPFPIAANLVGTINNVAGFDLHAATPYTQNWNLTVEHEIGAGSALEIAYVGSKGTHLSRKYNLNQPIRSAALAPNFPRPYPLVGTIDFYGFYVNSIYNAGTVSFRKRFTRGFFYRLNYTYAKSIDEGSQSSGNSDGGIGQPQNSLCLRCDRGRSDWDRGHVFTMNFSYEVPWRKNVLVRGWQLTGTGRAYTGTPFTPQVSNINLDQGDANRPDRILKGTLANPTPDMWYNIAAFPPLPTGSFRFGNSGRNILDGPGFLEINLSVFKNFYFEKHGSLQFRWEVFNALNHANLNLPNVNVNEPTAGTIPTAGTPRLMQFGLRYRF